MVDLCAKRIGYDLREYGVSLISVEGLNFDCFLPLFGAMAINIPVAVITDADPFSVVRDGAGKEKWEALYPALGEAITPSGNTMAMKRLEDAFVKVFYGVKTFEYDFALHESNRTAMLAAFKEIHPRIAESVEETVKVVASDAEKAKALFCGMFEREQGNVQKGRFAQTLAAKINEDELDIVVPNYIRSAIKHACS